MPTLQRGNVSLHYEEAGDNGPPLLLVHGWGCDLSFMAPQFEAFHREHRVVSVDLRGHGQSDKPVQEYTIPAFADDLAWTCHELELDRPVVVGHSMGGAIALELATGKQPLSGVVLLDSAVLPGPEVWAGVQPVRAALHTPGYREVLRRFLADAFFLKSGDAVFKDAAIAAMLQTPQHVLASAFDEIFAWDSVAAAKECGIATLYIASTRPRGDVARFHELCPSLVDGRVVSAGHFVQLEVPDQVNAMIHRFLETSVPGWHRS